MQLHFETFRIIVHVFLFWNELMLIDSNWNEKGRIELENKQSSLRDNTSMGKRCM